MCSIPIDFLFSDGTELFSVFSRIAGALAVDFWYIYFVLAKPSPDSIAVFSALHSGSTRRLPLSLFDGFFCQATLYSFWYENSAQHGNAAHILRVPARQQSPSNELAE